MRNGADAEGGAVETLLGDVEVPTIADVFAQEPVQVLVGVQL
jgi:hypothetical protein